LLANSDGEIKIEKNKERVMKKYFIVSSAIFLVLVMVAAAMAMQHDSQSSLLLVKKGQLMKLVYEHSVTSRVAEMKARFKKFGWREPGDEMCIPERADIFVSVLPRGTRFIYCEIRNRDEITVQGAISAKHSAWRMADTVMYYADKHRPLSLLHPPKP